VFTIGEIRKMPSLRIHALTPDQVPQAYPLVRLVASDLSLDAWRNFACQRISQIESQLGGIHTVQDTQGNILGFASYATDISLHDGRILTVDNLVVVGTIERQRDFVLLALLGALERIATKHCCETMQFRLEAAGSTFLDQHIRVLLETAGHRERYVLFSKMLETAD
jgi:hypothetical protein